MNEQSAIEIVPFTVFTLKANMEQTSILSVRITKPGDVSYAEIMIRLRTWLDAAKIQPKSFRSVTDGFELRFHIENEVQRFTAEFG